MGSLRQFGVGREVYWIVQDMMHCLPFPVGSSPALASLDRGERQRRRRRVENEGQRSNATNVYRTSRAPAFGRLLLRRVARQRVGPRLIQSICTVSNEG